MKPNPEQSAAINRRLDAMLKARQSGETFTNAQIAAACGISRQAIDRIESLALRKVGRRFIALGMKREDF